jgi:hypothetical protein
MSNMGFRSAPVTSHSQPMKDKRVHRVRSLYRRDAADFDQLNGTVRKGFRAAVPSSPFASVPAHSRAVADRLTIQSVASNSRRSSGGASNAAARRPRSTQRHNRIGAILGRCAANRSSNRLCTKVPRAELVDDCFQQVLNEAGNSADRDVVIEHR